MTAATVEERLDDLAALVGTVCPACRSLIMQHSDGFIFCFDPYCGQQKDLYLELKAAFDDESRCDCGNRRDCAECMRRS